MQKEKILDPIAISVYRDQIYNKPEMECLRYQKPYDSKVNALKFLARYQEANKNTTGSRRGKRCMMWLCCQRLTHSHTAASFTKSPTKTSGSGRKTRGVVPDLVSVSGYCTWPMVWSFWSDAATNQFLHMWLVLPSGCRVEDVSVTLTGRKIIIQHSWPAVLFSPEKLFAFMVTTGGAVPSIRPGDPRAMGLKETCKKLKKTADAMFVNELHIDLPVDVEPNFVDFGGKFDAPAFHKVNNGTPYGSFIMTLGCMVQRAALFKQKPTVARDFD